MLISSTLRRVSLASLTIVRISGWDMGSAIPPKKMVSTESIPGICSINLMKRSKSISPMGSCSQVFRGHIVHVKLHLAVGSM